MINKTLILDRLKAYFHLKGNGQLAEFLGVTRQTISNWYSRNSVDYDVVITQSVAIDENIDLKWLLTNDSNELSPKEHTAKDDYEKIQRSVNFYMDDYERFNAFANPLLNKCGYKEDAKKTEELNNKIQNISEFADESCIINELRRLYVRLKKEDISEVQIQQEMKSLISKDKLFYSLVAPYKRELDALDSILELTELRRYIDAPTSTKDHIEK
ncbi:helix-turn-helix domain-containing protein [Xylanibacter muris]|uniref:helix-turn-helix domain-containing protein n=1 Tax=Xylanibacter muris TaxID=2736290 RepID=UPI0025A2CC11|nr:helix-turn-helix domain-containing protein [Xylanibacter muris]